MKRVVIIWPKYAPYNMARVRALANLQNGNIETIVFHLVLQNDQHAWATHETPNSVTVVTMIDTAYESYSAQKLARQLIEKLAECNPDAVVICGYDSGSLRSAARWAKAHGSASIVMFETTQWDKRRRWWREWPKSLFIRRYFDAGFTGGTSHTQYLRALGMPQDRIWGTSAVVDNAYFEQRSAEVRANIQEHRKRLGLPERYFLYVGRFSPEKNLLRLLEAYGKYQAEGRNPWGLVIVGDGPQREELHRTAARLGLDRVVWPGFKQIDELPVYYALSSAFILPSTVEPWGLVVNEAMACGLPLLVSDRCGCVVDLARNGENGFTFNPYDAPAIAESMGRLTSLEQSERVRMGQRSRDIVAGYTPEAWAESLADCVRQTVSRKSGRATASA